MLDKGPTAVYIDSVPNMGFRCVGCKHYQGVRSGGHGADNTTHTTAAQPSLSGLAEVLAVVTCTLLGGMSVRKEVFTSALYC